MIRWKQRSALFVCITLLWIAISHLNSAPVIGSIPLTKTTNFQHHSVYREYSFGSDENTIDIGIQPLWPPGVISEVMKRDRQLQHDLAAIGKQIKFHSFLKGSDVNYFYQIW